MNTLKSIITAVLFTVCLSQVAWAQTIENVGVDEDARTVTMLMNLCPGSLDESGIRTTLYGDTLNVSFTADDSAGTQCDSKLLVTLNIPPCVAFGEVGVFFYSAVLENETPSLQTGMGVDDANCISVQAMTVEVAEDVVDCQAEYNSCLAMAGLGSLFLGGCDATCCAQQRDVCLENQTPEEPPVVKEVEIYTNPVIQVVYNSEIECAPKKLNVKSRGKWVTCSITGAGDLGQAETVALDVNGQPVVASKVVVDGDKLVVKLEREEVANAAGPDFPAEVVIGWNGAEDTIKVINRGKWRKNKKVKQGEKIAKKKK